jgi:hypothetical protein
LEFVLNAKERTSKINNSCKENDLTFEGNSNLGNVETIELSFIIKLIIKISQVFNTDKFLLFKNKYMGGTLKFKTLSNKKHVNILN